MIVEIDPHAAAPPYEQLRAQIAALIRSGELPVGTRLPSIRQLASDLGLASGTVARAYRELEGGGFLRGRVGKGTVVQDVPEMPEQESGRRLREAARAYAAVVRELGIPVDAALTAVRAHLIEPPPAPEGSHNATRAVVSPGSARVSVTVLPAAESS